MKRTKKPGTSDDEGDADGVTQGADRPKLAKMGHRDSSCPGLRFEVVEGIRVFHPQG